MYRVLLPIIFAFLVNNSLASAPYVRDSIKNSTNANLYLGASNSLNSPNLFYLHSGLRIACNKKNNTYFSMDYYYNSKQVKYTLYSPNDYSFKYNRNAILVGLDFNLVRIKRIKVNLGFSFTQAFLDGKLVTNEASIKEVLEDNFSRTKSSLSLHLLNTFNLKSRLSIYNKVNLNLTETSILNKTTLTVGVSYKMFSLPKTQSIPKLLLPAKP